MWSRHLFSYDSQIVVVERDLSWILQVTRAIRNTTPPVNRLPPEILSRVLEHDAYDQILVAATHVCRYWRSTLIFTPSLWNCFQQFESDHNLDRTLTYLERSKPAPIDISINTDLLEDLEVFEYLALHIARTRSLVIQGSCGIHTASLLFCNPAPSLQYLHISSSSSKGFVPLPDNFLGRQAPSLRTASFTGICLTFESPFPLPNLTEFNLLLFRGRGSFCIDAMFRFFSSCPQLRKIRIDVPNGTLRDTSQRRIVSLESLVEFDYMCNLVNRILPSLRLPRLKQLRVSSLQPGRTQKLTDMLPYGSHALLAEATNMEYYSYKSLLSLRLSGDGVDVSLSTPLTTADHTNFRWLSDETRIPFNQIEELKVEGCSLVNLPANLFAFENLRVLQITPLHTQLTEGFLRPLHPDPGLGIPCRSPEEIKYTHWESPGPILRPLIGLVRERKWAGHQLKLVEFMTTK